MSRAAQVLKSKVIVFVVAFIVIVGGVGASVWHYESLNTAQIVTNAQHQVTEVTYHGQNGVNALTLLKKYATVQTKQYSFGAFVTSINGTPGNGPKYWTFYINNKEASVGAGEYTTKNGDILTWKLQ